MKLPSKFTPTDWRYDFSRIYYNQKFSETQVAQFCHIKARCGIANGEVGSYSFALSFAVA
ncbi:hypothetical protein MNB_SUP05-SYMBIONT-5-911 [hydrothermal vent metagenome]|uniref:Uncharacterized protein n=1 Tax=hydrothermal vent metagenome TaxID=652676 RepID=A0A1W1E1N5_9ZZZZ